MISLDRLIRLSPKHSLFLFGPRQVGKSTLIKSSFRKESLLTYNLLIPEELRRLTLNPGRFREEVLSRSKSITHVFIDEIQKLPSLLDEVHYLLEESSNPPCFILTGSSARKLKQNNANMLGGRAFNYSLSSLTHFEIINALGQEAFSLYKILELGSLPAVYLSDRDTAIHLLRSYVNIYLNEEIKLEALVRNLEAFSQFLHLSAEINGQIINYSNLSRDIGVSSITVKEYYQILEDTLLGFHLRPFTRDVRKQIAKHPKFYFFDTGVVRALNDKLSQELHSQTQAFGDAFEHFIIKEFVDISKALAQDFRFSFYRTENNAEVDLIIECPDNTVYAVEIKSSASPQLKDLRGLKSFAEICPEAILCCASTAPKVYKLADVVVYPWQELFREVFNKTSS